MGRDRVAPELPAAVVAGEALHRVLAALQGLVEFGDSKPTDQSYVVFKDLSERLDKQSKEQPEVEATVRLIIGRVYTISNSLEVDLATIRSLSDIFEEVLNKDALVTPFYINVSLVPLEQGQIIWHNP